MTRRARRAAPKAAPARPRRSSARPDSAGTGRWLAGALALIGIVALAAIMARGIGAGAGPTAETASTVRPFAAESSSESGSTTAGLVSGPALAPFTNGADSAIGSRVPSVRGTTMTGAALDIPAGDGRAKVVLFLAHWCGHCQAEVPRVQAWIDAGSAPADVDLYAVSTSADPQRPNYPPAAWLEREHWSVGTIADDDAGTIAQHFGLQAFPYFVFVHADGTVARRTAGELSIAELESILAGLRR